VSSSLRDSSKNSEIETNSEFKESSVTGDCSKDSKEGFSQVEIP